MLQIEKQINTYEEIEDTIIQDIAVIKLQDKQGNYNFKKDNKGCFYHTIRYKENSVKEGLMTYYKDYNGMKDLGFHFDAYDFDSKPEKDFFNRLFNLLSFERKNVDDIYFTGSITDKNKTDFYFEYQNEDKNFVSYYFDFLIRKTNGKFLIVEIKSKRDIELPEVKAKENAMKTIIVDNSDKFQYIIIEIDTAKIEDNNKNLKRVEEWINNK